MSTKKKLLLGSAGAAAAGGAGLDVDEVFSTYLYDGTGSTQTITNGIDLSGEGGLVWTKSRSDPRNHSLHDSARGVTCLLKSNATNAQYCDATQMASFNSNGFTVGSDGSSNTNGDEYVSWTWRKAPKFFDVVTYTGTQDGDKTISHSLDTTVGMAIIKRYDSAGYDWYVYHTSRGTSKYLLLNGTNAEASGSIVTATSNTSITLSQSNGFNTSGATYVVYLFAHNNSDGEFGPDADQDVIKCGSYTGVSSTEISVNLGFEPQWVMIKRATGTSLGAYASWFMQDVMRGMVAKSSDAKDNVLYANKNSAEGFRGDGSSSTSTEIQIHPNATGFTVPSTNSVEVNQAGETYIYMAIRRGPLAEPTSATDVFSIDTLGSSAPYFDSNHIVDMALVKSAGATGDWYNYARHIGEKYLKTNATSAEANASEAGFDFMDGHIDANWGGTNAHSWMWKRAPSYFDVVAYSGDGTSSNTINHNLGVVPEMMWFKRRDSSTAGNWLVYHNSYLTTQALFLNSTGALISSQTGNLQSTPTNSSFTVGSYNSVNNSSGTYIAYLFATVAGVSKVGSYTGDGNAGRVIDCGFSNGARFVLARSYTHADNWFVFDSERGIVAGNDPRLWLNTTDAEVTNADLIDVHSSGFIVNNANGELNDTGRSYIFYAIAA